jgi:hypothetical protein
MQRSARWESPPDITMRPDSSISGRRLSKTGRNAGTINPPLLTRLGASLRRPVGHNLAETDDTLSRSKRRGHAQMQPHFAEFVGIAAAAASLYATQSKTIIPLRAAAIAANFLGMIYFLMHEIYPTFLLNLVMLPLNAWRLRSMVIM